MKKSIKKKPQREKKTKYVSVPCRSCGYPLFYAKATSVCRDIMIFCPACDADQLLSLDVHENKE